MKKSYATLTFALALSALLPLPVLAEGDNQDGRMMGGRCPMMGMTGQGMMGSMMEGGLAYWKAELKISDAQGEAWSGYADAVKGRVNITQGMHEGMMGTMQKGNAVERMDAHIAGMEAMLSSMKAVKPTTEKLYSVLTAEQKKVADQLIGVSCGAM